MIVVATMVFRIAKTAKEVNAAGWLSTRDPLIFACPKFLQTSQSVAYGGRGFAVLSTSGTARPAGRTDCRIDIRHYRHIRRCRRPGGVKRQAGALSTAELRQNPAVLCLTAGKRPGPCN